MLDKKNAFLHATDVNLTVDECVERDRLVMERLSELSIPAVFLGGGGYSKDSAKAITKSITNLYNTM